MQTIPAGAVAPHYIERVKPFFDLLQRLVLPPRGKKNSRQNKQRALMVASALHQEALRRGGMCKAKSKHRNCRLCRTKVKLLPAAS